MGLIDNAAALAREAHAAQRRKGRKGDPYFTHLESVAERLRAAGIDDEVSLAAAYLHDLLEDQPGHAPALRALHPAVLASVEVLTERKLDEAGVKRSKSDRVRDYQAALSADNDHARRARAISCADKIDNIESLLAAEQSGDQLLLKLSTRPGEHLPQLAAMRLIYANHVPAPLLAAFDDATRRLADYLTAWLPGRAVAIAAAAHTGQFDKSHSPYILHPMRLMLRAETASARMVAILHDVLEDSPWTRADLAAEGFPPDVLDALDCLTKLPGESYEDFITRVLRNTIATRVKLLDLEDNMDPRRLPALGPSDLERLAKYHEARRRILAHLSK